MRIEKSRFPDLARTEKASPSPGSCRILSRKERPSSPMGASAPMSSSSVGMMSRWLLGIETVRGSCVFDCSSGGSHTIIGTCVISS